MLTTAITLGITSMVLAGGEMKYERQTYRPIHKTSISRIWDSNGGSIPHGREEVLPSAKTNPHTETRTVVVTAYTSRVEETDDTPCIAASGRNLCEESAGLDGTILLDNKRERQVQFCAFNSVPFGTRIIVPGFGECEVVDRTSKRFTGRLDLYYGQDLKGARAWGKQTKEITIIYAN